MTENHMAEVFSANWKSGSSKKRAVGRLFVLELNAGRIHSMSRTVPTVRPSSRIAIFPDGIVVDVEAGHIYWTNMGIPNLNDGSIERADIDGKNRKDHRPARRAPTRRSRSISIRRTASSIGATARACA